MKKSTRKENEQIWKTLAARSHSRLGSVEAFCKAEGVSPSAFGFRLLAAQTAIAYGVAKENKRSLAFFASRNL